MTEPKYHFFLSYASEDLVFVGQLAEALESQNMKVWFAPFELKPGDSIVQRINEGLRRTSIGVVCISQSFLGKPWPRRELDSLIALMISEPGRGLIPLLRGLTHSQYSAALPLIADLFYLQVEDGMEQLVSRLGSLSAIEFEPSSEKIIAEERGKLASFASLDEAITASGTDATVYVYPGVYSANVEVRRPTRLVGRGARNKTIIETPAQSAWIVCDRLQVENASREPGMRRAIGTAGR